MSSFRFGIKKGKMIQSKVKSFDNDEQALKYGLKTWKDELYWIKKYTHPQSGFNQILIYVRDVFESAIIMNSTGLKITNRKVGTWYLKNSRRKQHQIIKDYTKSLKA